MTAPTADERLAYPFTPPNPLEPPTQWQELRQGCPVAHIRLDSGAQGLLLSRYDDVKAMLADPRFVRGSMTGEPGGVGDSPRATAGDDAEPGLSGGSSILEGDGHLRWRRILGKTFTVRRVRAMRPGIEALAHRFVDDMLACGAPADLQATFGLPLPVFVICDLLGVPAHDRADFSAWSDRVLSLSRYTREESTQAGLSLFGYMDKLVRERADDPGDDLLSELVQFRDDQGPLTQEELVTTGLALLIAGHETTANMIGKSVAMLLSPREGWEQLLAHRDQVRTAVEECLRFDANLGFPMSRYVDRPLEIGGTNVEPGTTVWSLMASANRDESVFADADVMDLTRSPNPHLTFGVGPHSCLGQTLARTELQVALEVLLERVPTLRLAVDAAELGRREGLLVGGLEAVPVEW